MTLLVLVPALVVGGAVAAAVAIDPSSTPEHADAAARVDRPAPSPTPRATPTRAATPAEPTFTAAQLDDPTSTLVVVDKQRPFHPKDWAPADLVRVGTGSEQLRPEAATALGHLFAAAKKAGKPLVVHSAYRSYPVQVSTYEGWVAKFGKKSADAQSARPGYSEHQSGLALDVLDAGSCGALSCFGTTPQAAWLGANAWRYGFVVRYPKGEQAVTGYVYEPWHIRYVGTAVAKGMHDSGETVLETYVGLPAAPDY
ncbi:D-alanyl-D-alanine carboxypeptidase [Luteimicrobium subarcticum]|uniref:D-alanyl-D-alanine carboxypeptidase n=2 Tax=Luteimicrobium subarcticum TaxID=620910 RepID=A0A2M8W749_9MICO|nr:D-alanyl-D-alanine carboxypeptidase [Luteimicrobium subarcticum]